MDVIIVGNIRPTEGFSGLKNIHQRLFLVIIVLLIASIYVAVKYPIRLGLDIKGGMRVVLRAKTNDRSLKGKWIPEKLTMVADIMGRRVNALGVAEPVVYPKPPDQIVVELPGLTNKAEALDTIKSTAKLEFRYVPELDPNGEWSSRSPEEGKATGFEEIVGRDGKTIPAGEMEERVFSKDPILEGDQLLANSRAEADPQRGVVINFEFKDSAKNTFEDFTRSHTGKTLAIFLDKKLISAPVIQDVIPGKGIIEGKFSPEQAKQLAELLNAGALPVPLEIESNNSVEATLGKQAVQKTLVAGIVGLVVVLLFMLVWYRLPGAIADVSLILYALFTFALFKLIPVTLTVPGIAGFILSIGMAVDANILIFERMKEERKAGKSLRAAIETGFKRAFSAIFDSNVCTLITCVILYNFGTGQVRGFALTLALGVIVSLFTAVTASRTFLLLMANTKFGQNDDLYGLNLGFHPRLNVTKRMGFWFGISGLLIVPGMIFWAMGGIKQSIEFTGGTEISAQFVQKPTLESISNAMASMNHKEARVLIAESNRAFITTRQIPLEEQASVLKTISIKVGAFSQETNIDPKTNQPVVQDAVSVSSVSPAISKELTHNALLAVIYASLLIILYLAFRFSVPNLTEGLKFGTCAVAALLHDVAVVWGAFAIFGYFLNWQIDSLYVTAILTVIGFSVHDTIVIFDRIRENLHYKARGESFAEVTDRSIEQTFARSVNTTGTVVITLLALLLLGGPVIRLFVSALLIGVISGTYSSIFNASPLLVLWKRFGSDKSAAPVTATGSFPVRTPAPRSATPSVPRSTVQKVNTNTSTEDAESSTVGVRSKKRRRRM